MWLWHRKLECNGTTIKHYCKRWCRYNYLRAFKNHFIFEVICLIQIASNRNFGASKFLLLGDRTGAERRKKGQKQVWEYFSPKNRFLIFPLLCWSELYLDEGSGYFNHVFDWFAQSSANLLKIKPTFYKMIGHTLTNEIKQLRLIEYFFEKVLHWLEIQTHDPNQFN